MTTSHMPYMYVWHYTYISSDYKAFFLYLMWIVFEQRTCVEHIKISYLQLLEATGSSWERCELAKCHGDGISAVHFFIVVS